MAVCLKKWILLHSQFREGLERVLLEEIELAGFSLDIIVLDNDNSLFQCIECQFHIRLEWLLQKIPNSAAVP